MKVLLIEDENLALKRLIRILEEINLEVEIAGCIRSLDELFEWYDEDKYDALDLIISDINLGDGVSFEFFDHIDNQIPIIFITAYDEYAIKAFEQFAVSYLLKPIKIEDLKKAMDKFNDRFNRPRPNLNELVSKLHDVEYKERFLLKIGRKMSMVRAEDIAYVYSRDKINYLVTEDNRKFPIDYTLENLDKMLDPQFFFRANRQIIVRLGSISEMIAVSKSRLKIKLNPPYAEDPIVSTEKSPQFKKWLLGE